MSSKKPRVKIFLGSNCQGDGEIEAVGGSASLCLYTDSSCSLLVTGHRRTTVRQMDIISAIQALKMLNEPCRINIYTQSERLIHAFKGELIKRWQHNGWKTSMGSLVQDRVLWEALLQLVSGAGHEVTFSYFKTGGMDKESEVTDKLSSLVMDQLKKNVDLSEASIAWQGDWETFLSELGTDINNIHHMNVLAEVSQSYKK